MKLSELTPGDDFTMPPSSVEYEYDGYKNYHRTGFMHWVIKDGVKIAYGHNVVVALV